jgi:hypothetical protein
MGTSSKKYRLERDEALTRLSDAEKKLKQYKDKQSARLIGHVFCANCRQANCINFDPTCTEKTLTCTNCKMPNVLFISGGNLITNFWHNH